MSDDLIKLHSTNDKLMPFFLPVQSGSSSFEKMNRKYDIDFYIKIDKLKRINPKSEIF